MAKTTKRNSGGNSGAPGGPDAAAKPTPAKTAATDRPGSPATVAVDLGTTTRSDAPPKPETAAAPAMPNVARGTRTPPDAASVKPEQSGASKPGDTVSAKPEQASANKPGDAAKPKLSPEAPDALARAKTSDTPPVPPTPATPPAKQRGSGFGAGLLGGLIAAALGLGGGWLWLQQQDAADTTPDRLATLEQSVAELAPLTDDTAALRQQTETTVAELGTQVAALREEVAARIEDFDARLEAVERQPSRDGTLTENAIASWQADVDKLRADLEAQAQEITAMATEAAARLEQTEASAEQVTQDASLAARMAEARAALAQIRAALDTGTGYAEPLEALRAASEDELPEALVANAEEGVASMASLTEAYPDAARDALAAARNAGVAGEDGGRVSAFFRNQFQLRATAPQEGDSANAVLSRIEAALSDDRLPEALGLVDSLPAEAQDALFDWAARARTRTEAIAAAETLSQSLTEN